MAHRFNIYRWSVLGASLALLSNSDCRDDSSDPPPFRHETFFRDLQTYADAFTIVDGDWREDLGDAAFYGLAFYSRVRNDSVANRDRAAVAYARNIQLLRDEDWLTGDANEIIMALLGVIEHDAVIGHSDNPEPVADQLTGLLSIFEICNGYVPPEMVPGYAMEIYGPTSINGLMALVPVQHVSLIGGPAEAEYLADAEWVAETIHRRAWNGSYYQFSENQDGLFLYPNVTMILLNTRLYQITRNRTYRERALAAYAGIQPLKVRDDSGWIGPGRYRSPYSAECMGATSEDYSTLSSHNYLMLALALLFEVTGDPRYLTESDAVLDFIRDNLVGTWSFSDIHTVDCTPPCGINSVCIAEHCADDHEQPGVLHHWMDGRLAVPSDSSFFCSGCNLQLLYVMWYRQQLH